MTRQLAVVMLGYLVAVNLVAYAAMVIDKARSETNSKRVPESTLFSLALISGSVGTVLAQQTIRHKTRKQPFRSGLAAIVLIQALALISLTVGLITTGSPDALWQFPEF